MSTSKLRLPIRIRRICVIPFCACVYVCLSSVVRSLARSFGRSPPSESCSPLNYRIISKTELCIYRIRHARASYVAWRSVRIVCLVLILIKTNLIFITRHLQSINNRIDRMAGWSAANVETWQFLLVCIAIARRLDRMFALSSSRARARAYTIDKRREKAGRKRPQSAWR